MSSVKFANRKSNNFVNDSTKEKRYSSIDVHRLSLTW